MDCAVDHPYRSGRFGGTSEGPPLRPGGLDLTRRAARYAGFASGDRILDLGCGEGLGTQVLCAEGCRVIGLDLISASLASATTRLAAFWPVVAGAGQLPLADASVDGIIAECSISLTENRRQALAECWRVLHAGARLAITDVFARDRVVEWAEGDARASKCLAGLATQDEILADLAQAGFRLEVWEDHSDVLKVFMARLILESESPNMFWGANGAAANAALRKSRPGYYLLIASKIGGDS